MPGFPNNGLVVGAIAAAALVAGCGGGSKPAASSSSSSTGGSKNPAGEFSAANVSGLGTVLVDGKGRTVYILVSGGKNVPCTDSSGCTNVWPDLPFPSGTSSAKAGTGATASLLASKKESDGETYPTYNGWLLYEYTGDSGPGQANGQGIKSFGGTWYVLNASGKPVTTKSGGGGSAY